MPFLDLELRTKFHCFYIFLNTLLTRSLVLGKSLSVFCHPGPDPVGRPRTILFCLYYRQNKTHGGSDFRLFSGFFRIFPDFLEAEKAEKSGKKGPKSGKIWPKNPGFFRDFLEKIEKKRAGFEKKKRGVRKKPVFSKKTGIPGLIFR